MRCIISKCENTEEDMDGEQLTAIDESGLKHDMWICMKCLTRIIEDHITKPSNVYKIRRS